MQNPERQMKAYCMKKDRLRIDPLLLDPFRHGSLSTYFACSGVEPWANILRSFLSHEVVRIRKN